MIKKIAIPSFILMMLVMTSCSKIVPDAQIPAYLQIDSFAYVCDSAVDVTYSKTHNIENVWVYADNVFLGVYTLPAKVPVLKTGNVKFDLKPGIKQNGISNTRVAYPFYQSYSPTYNLVAGQTIVVPATTKYFSFVKIPFSESFELNDLQLERLVSTKGVNIIKKQGIFEGKYGGEIFLTGNDTVCQIAAKTAFTLPIGGLDVYLELDYKTSTAFTFGILAYTSTATNQQQIFTFNPSTNANGDIAWKRIYIDMAPEIGNNSTALDYKIYFYATKKASDPDVHIYLDNIKVVKVSG